MDGTNKEIIGYMCQTDWDWELGEAMGGTRVYASVKDLKRDRKCVEQCGIVEVRVTLEKIVDPGKPFGASDDT